MTTPLEETIAREPRRVLDNPERPPTPDFGHALRSLLSLHLPGQDFQEIVHPTIRIRPDHRLEVRSLIVREDSGKWVELFGADLHPEEDRDLLLDYVLYFGRQDLPGRRVAYDQRAEILPELRRAGEWSWAQVFRKS